MSGQTARQTIIGLGKETTPGTPVTPTVYPPVMNPQGEDIIAEIEDTAIRANDTATGGVYPGPAESTYGFDMHAYPDLLPHLMLGIIGGTDVPVAAVTTTVAAGGGAQGASTISLTASVPVNATLKVVGAAVTEARQVVSVTGAGPYTVTVNAPWAVAHVATEAATTGTLHPIKQAAFPQPQIPSYSITDYELIDTRVYPGCKVASVQLKLDAKGTLQATPKYQGFPSQNASQPTPTYTGQRPLLGWTWATRLGGTLTTRYLTADLTISRGVEAIHSSDGTQGPREVYAGALAVSGTVKAILDVTTDRDMLLNYTQTNGLSLEMSDPVSGGGLTLVLSKPAFTKFTIDRSSEDTYAKADMTVKGIFNATDGGALAAYITNSVATAF